MRRIPKSGLVRFQGGRSRAKVDQFSSDALVEMLALAGIELQVRPHVARRVA